MLDNYTTFEILYEEEGNGYLGLSYEEKYGLWVLHFEVTKWSAHHYKRYLVIFSHILRELKNRGISEVYGFSLNEKAQKLVRMFGFTLTPAVGLSQGIIPFSVLKKYQLYFFENKHKKAFQLSL